MQNGYAVALPSCQNALGYRFRCLCADSYQESCMDKCLPVTNMIASRCFGIDLDCKYIITKQAPCSNLRAKTSWSLNMARIALHRSGG